MTKDVETFLRDGCMRCKFGGTIRCKVNDWGLELNLLRQIALSTGLREEMKWGTPVYTKNGKNIFSVNVLKASANISFFKGSLLLDHHQLLQQQGNAQATRIMKFTDSKTINKLKKLILSYMEEAVSNETKGAKVSFIKNPEPIPQELLSAFDADPQLKKAFFNLTPGRQRGYIIHFSKSTKSETRMRQIEKHKKQILEGKGMHDRTIS